MSANEAETFKLLQNFLERGFHALTFIATSDKTDEKLDVFSIKTGIRQVKIKKCPQGLGCEAAGSEIYINFWSE